MQLRPGRRHIERRVEEIGVIESDKTTGKIAIGEHRVKRSCGRDETIVAVLGSYRRFGVHLTFTAKITKNMFSYAMACEVLALPERQFLELRQLPAIIEKSVIVIGSTIIAPSVGRHGL